MSYIGNAIPSATTLGGELDVNGNKIVSNSNGNIELDPNGTGNVVLGNYVLDGDGSFSNSEDDYVFTYNHSAGTIGLEAIPGLSSDSVTYDMIQDTSSSDVVLGRYSSGAGTIQEIDMASLKSIMGGMIYVQEEGSTLSNLAHTLNFVGSAVTASGTGTTKTITISGGSTGNITFSGNVIGSSGDIELTPTGSYIKLNERVYISDGGDVNPNYEGDDFNFYGGGSGGYPSVSTTYFGATGQFRFSDNTEAIWGSSNDFTIEHENNNNRTAAKINNHPFRFMSRTGENTLLEMNEGAGVKLYYDGGTNPALETLSGSAVKFNNAFTFPTADGNANEVLTTDGSGTVTWAAAGGGGGGGGFSQDSNNNLVAGTSAGNALGSSSNYNIAIGQSALLVASSSGDDYHVAIGYQAGERISGSSGPCIAIGKDVLTTFTGAQDDKIFMGRESGYYHTNGGPNVIAMGYNAGSGNNIYDYIAIGNHSGMSHNGEDSIWIGHQTSMNQSQHCDQSVVIGNDVLTTSHGGHGNKMLMGRMVVIGYNAYLNGGKGSSDGNNDNTIIGHSAGSILEDGVNNISIGYDSQPAASSTNNSITLGNTSIGSFRCNVQSISSLSDVRDKKDIEDIDIGLDFINDLRPVNFTWDRRDGSMNEIKSQGFIAQEVDEAQQKHNCEEHLQAVLKENPEKLEMSYGKLVPALVKAIQELSSRVEELENGNY